ncbi:HIT domain-containing protein [bacterium]|jgi:histidine triad (HIT) family protein|nr:HIT domain-containing protein [bacterium]
MEHNECIFCKIIRNEIPSTIIAESEQVLVIKDINPKAPVHYLIIPKKHIKDIREFHESDRHIAGDILFMARQLANDLPEPGDFKLVSNNGPSSGQCVFHSHFHFLSGKKVIDI